MRRVHLMCKRVCVAILSATLIITTVASTGLTVFASEVELEVEAEGAVKDVSPPAEEEKAEVVEEISATENQEQVSSEQVSSEPESSEQISSETVSSEPESIDQTSENTEIATLGLENENTGAEIAQTVDVDNETVDVNTVDAEIINAEIINTETTDAVTTDTETTATETTNTETTNAEITNTEIVNTEIANTETISDNTTTSETDTTATDVATGTDQALDSGLDSSDAKSETDTKTDTAEDNKKIENVTVTIKFNVNGGTGELADIVKTVPKGTEITLPTAAEVSGISKDGYYFECWTKSAYSTGSLNFRNIAHAYIANEDNATVTYYAYWHKNDSTTKLSVNYYIRLRGDIPSPYNSYSKSLYTDKVDGDYTEAVSAVDGAYIYNPAGDVIDEISFKKPTEAQIKAALDAKDWHDDYGNSYNSNLHRVCWYVLKKEETDGYHIDGVVQPLSKVNITYDANISSIKEATITNEMVSNMPNNETGDKGCTFIVSGNVPTIKTTDGSVYTFKGWYEKGKEDIIYESGYAFEQVVEDVHLYAKWEQTKGPDPVEDPKVEDPKPENPKDPETEDPKVEDSKDPETEEPKVEDPKDPETEEPKVEDPKDPETEEPKVEEPEVKPETPSEPEVKPETPSSEPEVKPETPSEPSEQPKEESKEPESTPTTVIEDESTPTAPTPTPTKKPSKKPSSSSSSSSSSESTPTTTTTSTPTVSTTTNVTLPATVATPTAVAVPQLVTIDETPTALAATVDIADEDVPLANTISIMDEDVPLASMPTTGDNSRNPIPFAAAGVFAMLGAIILNVRNKKKIEQQ